MKEEITLENKSSIIGLGNALEEITKRQQEVDSKGAIWFKNFEEMTGYKPNQPINALDVVKIMYKFWGEPKND